MKNVNGWGFTTKTGIYGTDYLMRALRDSDRSGRQSSPGCGLSDVAERCRTARPYEGTNKYVMHFPKGQLPPVHGFWSMTMYNEKYFFVAIRSTAIRSARGKT